MLEMCVNQAAGLQSIGLQAAPRVIAVASHGDQRGELPLLWGLCATLVGQGYPVAVLDATSEESPANPGLTQILDAAHWQHDDDGAPLAWSVIPAALGLQRLSNETPGGRLPLDALGGLFENYGVVVIYARTAVLSRVLADSGVEPLLTVSAAKMSCITAYQALKHLLLKAGLRPTIASLEEAPVSSMKKPSPVNNLQDCAMTFLDYRLDTLVVRHLQTQDEPSDDLHRLALRLLENAMPLHRHPFVRSH